MKKFLAGLVILFVLMVSMPIVAEAQCRSRNCRSSVNRNRDNRVRNRNYQTRRLSFYQRNRNLINIAAGTGAGALIGGVLGGKKGVLIGSLIGAGASTLYSYKIRPKKRYRR
jgi:outer membrane lipoprotein SlyB